MEHQYGDIHIPAGLLPSFEQARDTLHQTSIGIHEVTNDTGATPEEISRAHQAYYDAIVARLAVSQALRDREHS